ncbi:alpha/beta hydrolase fold domain-containing protein [Sarocladium implicatum]|nr:alpha/beta hydrolase fold domain-containing protein [Sarocladium implicatum]
MPEPPYPLHPTIDSRIDPEYKAFYNQHVIDKQQVHYQPIEASRSSGILIPGAGPLIPVGKTQDFAIQRKESQGPDVKVRCFTPEGEAPAGGWPGLVYFHGGGWVLGSIDTENVVATNICARGKSVVVSVDYRLAPEDPFPACIEDAWEAVQWTLTKGSSLLNINTSKLATGGSSAGGHLASVMCQRASAAGRQLFRLQLLSVPVVDNTADTTNTTSWEENQHAPSLPAPKMLWYRNHFLPNREDWSHPEASPLFWKGDWASLPPAIIVLGQLDVLRSEGEAFGKKLTDAGVKADVHILKGQPHPFLAMDGVLQAGRDAITYFCEGMLKLHDEATNGVNGKTNGH